MEHLGYARVTHPLGFDAMKQGHFLEMHWIFCFCGIQCVSRKRLLCLVFLLPYRSVRGAPARLEGGVTAAIGRNSSAGTKTGLE